MPERSVDVRPDLGHVTDIQLVMNISLRFSNICVRLQQLSGWMLTEQARLLTTGRLLAKLPHEDILLIILWLVVEAGTPLAKQLL